MGTPTRPRHPQERPKYPSPRLAFTATSPQRCRRLSCGGSTSGAESAGRPSVVVRMYSASASIASFPMGGGSFARTRACFSGVSRSKSSWRQNAVTQPVAWRAVGSLVATPAARVDSGVRAAKANPAPSMATPTKAATSLWFIISWIPDVGGIARTVDRARAAESARTACALPRRAVRRGALRGVPGRGEARVRSERHGMRAGRRPRGASQNLLPGAQRRNDLADVLRERPRIDPAE